MGLCATGGPTGTGGGGFFGAAAGCPLLLLLLLLAVCCSTLPTSGADGLIGIFLAGGRPLRLRLRLRERVLRLKFGTMVPELGAACLHGGTGSSLAACWGWAAATKGPEPAGGPCQWSFKCLAYET